MIEYLTSGESHGPQLDIIIDGFPAAFQIDPERIDDDLAKRQTKLGSGDRQNIEHDHAIINSGVMNGHTTGSPLSFTVENKNHVAWKGNEIPSFTIPRPGHADKAGVFKYHSSDIREILERASARETTTRVILGSCCMQFLEFLGITVDTRIVQIGTNRTDLSELTVKSQIDTAISNGETVGGVLETTVDGLVQGIGSFSQPSNRLDAKIAKAIISIPAIKGIEFGAGFGLAEMFGTEAQRHLGGISGGMSDGSQLSFISVMKPIPTTIKPQESVDLTTMKRCQTKYERSDIAPILRTPIIVSSMTAYVILNSILESVGGEVADVVKQNYVNFSRYNFENMTSSSKIFW